MNLPGEFLSRMEAQLGSEYPAFLACYERPVYRGVRLNPLKCGEKNLRESLPFELMPSPFSRYSFYADCREGIGKLPAHHWTLSPGSGYLTSVRPPGGNPPR